MSYIDEPTELFDTARFSDDVVNHVGPNSGTKIWEVIGEKTHVMIISSTKAGDDYLGEHWLLNVYFFDKSFYLETISGELRKVEGDIFHAICKEIPLC